MPGLIALGMLKPAQANAIRSSYQEILRYHMAKARQEEKTLSDVDVLGLFHKNPEVFSLLEPLLTEEQVAMVMKRAGGADDGQA